MKKITTAPWWRVLQPQRDGYPHWHVLFPGRVTPALARAVRKAWTHGFIDLKKAHKATVTYLARHSARPQADHTEQYNPTHRYDDDWPAKGLRRTHPARGFWHDTTPKPPAPRLPSTPTDDPTALTCGQARSQCRRIWYKKGTTKNEELLLQGLDLALSHVEHPAHDVIEFHNHTHAPGDRHPCLVLHSTGTKPSS
jgi:hypothetical protein